MAIKCCAICAQETFTLASTKYKSNCLSHTDTANTYRIIIAIHYVKLIHKRIKWTGTHTSAVQYTQRGREREVLGIDIINVSFGHFWCKRNWCPSGQLAMAAVKVTWWCLDAWKHLKCFEWPFSSWCLLRFICAIRWLYFSYWLKCRFLSVSTMCEICGCNRFPNGSLSLLPF